MGWGGTANVQKYVFHSVLLLGDLYVHIPLECSLPMWHNHNLITHTYTIITHTGIHSQISPIYYFSFVFYRCRYRCRYRYRYRRLHLQLLFHYIVLGVKL